MLVKASLLFDQPNDTLLKRRLSQGHEDNHLSSKVCSLLKWRYFELFFLFGKSKSCMKTYVDFKLYKNLSSETIEYGQNL